MIGHQERAQLLQSYAEGSARPAAVLLTCSACLLILALVALIGAAAAPQDSAPAVQAQTGK